ncbi:MAG: hypothetical protein ACPG1A_03350 [Halioglobus sp.]
MQEQEVSVAQAINDAPVQAARLAELAAAHRAQHMQVDVPNTVAHWEPSAGTYCYQTHIAFGIEDRDTLNWLADTFYNAATMTKQPWYAQFLGGQAEALDAPPAEGIDQHQLAVGRFDLGLSRPRCYRQLVSLASHGETTRIIIARSVDEGPPIPDGTTLAYTLDPNGEVLHYENGLLHWHHICCTPGAGLLPQPADRWLINTLRRLRLDSAERTTYREEAQELRAWVLAQ